MKINSYYGIKKDQQQTFNQHGKRYVVTVVKVPPLLIAGIKTLEKDGYWSYQVNLKNLYKKTVLKEITIKEKPEQKKSEEIKITDIFTQGDLVKVSGITKGKGFAGVVKRWGFAGGPKTHGQSDRQRAPGSIGQGTDPGRVWKGKKMPGRMGGKQKTIKGLEVFKIDEPNNEIWLTGLIPGNKGGLVKITKTGKSKIKTVNLAANLAAKEDKVKTEEKTDKKKDNKLENNQESNQN